MLTQLVPFSALGASTWRPGSVRSISKWSLRELPLAWWVWRIIAKRSITIVQFGKAIAYEIQAIAATRRFLLERQHASSKQSSWALSDECRKSIGRIYATSVWLVFIESIADPVATSSCKCDTTNWGLRKKFQYFILRRLIVWLVISSFRCYSNWKHRVPRTMQSSTNSLRIQIRNQIFTNIINEWKDYTNI